MVRHALVSIALALAPVSLGCGGSVTSEPPVTADVATTRAPVAVAAHGPVRLFGEALGEVPLTATQRAAIEQLASDSEARHAQVRVARQDLMKALADQVEAGAIDRAALAPKVAALTSAIQASQPADRSAFEQLHAVLTPDQRAAFVDAVKAHVGQRMAQARDRHPLQKWAEELQLSDDQKAQIKATIAGRLQNALPDAARGERGAKHPGEAVMAAFKQETFVFDQVSPPTDVAAQVSHATDHFLAIAEATVPLLTPAQRGIAAQKLRERAANPDAEGHDLL